MSKATFIVLPWNLKNIHSNAFGSCHLLGSITFNSVEAPNILDLTAFGADKDTWTGKNAENRIVYVPSNSSGYDSEMWTNTIFNKNRITVSSSGVTECFYTLSQTL